MDPSQLLTQYVERTTWAKHEVRHVSGATFRITASGILKLKDGGGVERPHVVIGSAVTDLAPIAPHDHEAARNHCNDRAKRNAIRTLLGLETHE